MKISYKQLLDDMQNDYLSKSGRNLELDSDSGARIQAVASELFSLACYGDFVVKQVFPQTATGKYLDMHARLRDIARKKESGAKGYLTFYKEGQSTADTKVKSGTICCLSTNPHIQFATISDLIIPINSDSGTVKAKAISYGIDTNVGANTIDTIVNPPSGISRVTNSDAFLGGSEDESDESLRQRLINSYSVPPNGFNSESIKAAVLDIDDIIDCAIYSDEKQSRIEIYVRTRSGDLPQSLKDEIEKRLYIAKLAKNEIYISLAKIYYYDLSVDVHKSNKYNYELSDKIRSTVKDLTDTVKIGEDVKFNRIISVVSTLEGVDYCDIDSEDAINKVIYAKKGQCLVNRGVMVDYDDGTY